MSAGLTYDFRGFTALQARMNRLGRVKKREILDIIGAQVESQTRRRIQDEKDSPAVVAWPAWSDRYAKRRPAGKSLLMNEDRLLDTLTYLMVDQDSVEVGSNMIYAATHQFGDPERNIPARAFLGISPANEHELVRELDKYIDRVVGL
jgi:phage virion morphogenesis protein